MADVDALGFAQLLASPQVSDPEFYRSEYLRNAAASMSNADTAARQRAGQLFAQGDYAGASQALAPTDMKAAIGLQDRTSLQGAAAAAANGDPNAARSAAAQTGDLDQVQKAGASASGISAAHFTAYQAIGNSLHQLPEAPGDATGDPSTPRAQRLAAIVKSGFGDQFGVTPQQIMTVYGGSPGDLANSHLDTMANTTLPFNGEAKKDTDYYSNSHLIASGPQSLTTAGPETRVYGNKGGMVAAAQPLPAKAAPGDVLLDQDPNSPTYGKPISNQVPFENKPVTYGIDQNVQVVNGTSGMQTPSPASAAVGPPSGAGGHNGAGGGNLSADQVWANMVQRESGGRPGVTGPQTPYGRAQGMTQMLPVTAQAMAQKLGLPWRPDLMTGTTPDAAAYQQQLGRAYFDEGLAKGNGDPAYAAAYYQGGPNAAMHGPQNAAYVHAVTGSPKGPTDAPMPGTVPGLLHAATPTVQPATQYGLRGQQSVNGSFTPTPGANFSIQDAKSLRDSYFSSKTYEAADSAATAANTLHRILNGAKGNSGLTDMATLDGMIRTATGLSAKAGQTQQFMDHIGVPQEIQGRVGAVLGRGFLTPGVVEEAAGIMDQYARTHLSMLQARAASDSAFAKSNGFAGDLQLATPQLTAPSGAKWLPGAAASNQVAPNAAAPGPRGAPPVPPDQALTQARAYVAAHPEARAQVIGRLRGWGINPAGI